MIATLIKWAGALGFWILGLKALQFFWLPIVEKYTSVNQIGWVFAGYVFWVVGWIVVCCILSYHVHIKDLDNCYCGKEFCYMRTRR